MSNNYKFQLSSDPVLQAHGLEEHFYNYTGTVYLRTHVNKNLLSKAVREIDTLVSTSLGYQGKIVLVDLIRYKDRPVIQWIEESQVQKILSKEPGTVGKAVSTYLNPDW